MSGTQKPNPRPSSKPLTTEDVQRVASRAEIDIQRALDHIDRVYTARALYIYGLGLLLGSITEEFDDFMDLRPHEEQNFVSVASVFIGLFKSFAAIPPVSTALGMATTTAEGIVVMAQTISPPSMDPMRDEGVEKYLRNRALKLPLFQNILSRRYQLEYDRLRDREVFLNRMDASLQRDKVPASPIAVATDIVGAAPPEMEKDAIYELFAREHERMFKELMKTYVQRYVVLLRWFKQGVPNGEYQDLGISLYQGMNEAQWRQLYSRFGSRPNASIVHATAVRRLREDAQSLFLRMMFRAHLALRDPQLTEVGDLWRFWGAKLAETSQTWYGVSTLHNPP